IHHAVPEKRLRPPGGASKEPERLKGLLALFAQGFKLLLDRMKFVYELRVKLAQRRESPFLLLTYTKFAVTPGDQVLIEILSYPLLRLGEYGLVIRRNQFVVPGKELRCESLCFGGFGEHHP